jgi:hypothetical protein
LQPGVWRYITGYKSFRSVFSRHMASFIKFQFGCWSILIGLPGQVQGLHATCLHKHFATLCSPAVHTCAAPPEPCRRTRAAAWPCHLQHLQALLGLPKTPRCAAGCCFAAAGALSCLQESVVPSQRQHPAQRDLAMLLLLLMQLPQCEPQH